MDSQVVCSYNETVVSNCCEEESNCTCGSRTASVSKVLTGKKKQVLSAATWTLEIRK
jgi:hypothetical protein